MLRLIGIERVDGKETSPLDMIVFIIMILIIIKSIMVGISPKYAATMGPSMEPTIKEGDLLRLESTSLNKLKHGDIILVDPTEEYKKINVKYLKRCMGLPGDKIEVVEAVNQQEFIRRNGELLMEPYTSNYYLSVINSLETHGEKVTSEIIVPENQVYVLGDNRATHIFADGSTGRYSLDSREFGTVDVNPNRIVRASKLEDRKQLPYAERALFTFRSLVDRVLGKEEIYPYPNPNVNKIKGVDY